MTQSLDIIQPISVEVRRVTEADDHDAIAQKLMVMEVIKRWAKETVDAIEESAIERLKQIGGSVQVGEVRYWVGQEKKPAKCIDVKATVEALMNATEGDFNRFCEHLAANAIKPGAAKKTLAPADFTRLFRQDTVDKLEHGTAAEAAKVEQKLMSAPVAILEAKR